MKPGDLGFAIDLENTIHVLSSSDGKFAGSELKRRIKVNAYVLLSRKLRVSPAEAERRAEAVRKRYDGRISLIDLFSQEYGITRQEWFDNAWNINPAGLVEPADRRLRPLIDTIADRAIVVTSSPRNWAVPTLKHLGFGDLPVLSGESEICKPDTRVFRMAARKLRRPLGKVVSIGDQMDTEIEPALALGMPNIIIGSRRGRAQHRADNLFDALTMALSWERRR